MNIYIYSSIQTSNIIAHWTIFPFELLNEIRKLYSLNIKIVQMNVKIVQWTKNYIVQMNKK